MNGDRVLRVSKAALPDYFRTCDREGRVLYQLLSAALYSKDRSCCSVDVG